MSSHHKDPYTIPDYRIYKVEDSEELMKTQQALAAQGLRDPWLRNEVWRYTGAFSRTWTSLMKELFFRGFKYGFIASIITAAISTVADRRRHSHHHDGNKKHHRKHSDDAVEEEDGFEVVSKD